MADSRAEVSMDERPDVDAIAASLRADRSENETFIEVLAAKLEDALPGLAEVQRSGGRFGRPKRVEEIAVTVGDARFILRAGPAGRAAGSAEAEVEHRVRGIRLSGERVNVEQWLGALAQALADAAVQQTETRNALQKLLG
jgi:hypothetical protein